MPEPNEPHGLRLLSLGAFSKSHSRSCSPERPNWHEQTGVVYAACQNSSYWRRSWREFGFKSIVEKPRFLVITLI